MTKGPLDYGAIKNQVRFEDVLKKYDLKTGGRGVQRMILCPFHADRSPSCSINLAKKIFHCFACGEGGTILDFVARLERCSVSQAAQLLSQWRRRSADIREPSAKTRATHDLTGDNKPLAFELCLDPHHPYLAERGVSLRTTSKFGLGYCDHGVMKGRVCIPIHDASGSLVAYAGRWPGTPPRHDAPRYKFPPGFKKRQVLFNFHRVLNAKHIVVVEGYWSVFRLDALSIAAVALMGCSLSEAQENIVRRSRATNVTLLLDGDQPGRTATRKILPRLARSKNVHAPVLPDGVEPDTMPMGALKTAVELIVN